MLSIKGFVLESLAQFLTATFFFPWECKMQMGEKEKERKKIKTLNVIALYKTKCKCINQALIEQLLQELKVIVTVNISECEIKNLHC